MNTHGRRVYQRYCEEMKELSLTIMELLELSLGVERGYYREFFEDSRSIMRCNYYPPCPVPERTLGTGPHCDPTALTILLQDDVGGLEVLVDGEWRPVRPVPGAMVINIGDTFMVTNESAGSSAFLGLFVPALCCCAYSFIQFSVGFFCLIFFAPNPSGPNWTDYSTHT
jgi:isopenicillin N synthase-like dioxygenase